MKSPKTKSPDGHRMKACVIGEPISHSLSPLLHQSWISALQIKAEYTGCLSSAEAFVDTVRGLFSDPDFVGMNVTLPHKEAALQLAEQSSPAAQAVGAANVLIRKNGKLFAHNTDIEGFCAPLFLAHKASHWHGKKIVIIGAGGAARAAVIGAQKLNLRKIELINRTDARAQSLAAHFGRGVEASLWQNRHETLKQAALVVNASAAGMKNKPALDLSLAHLPKGALVYDLIYTPQETPLLLQAKQMGFSLLGGLDMLIAQARPSFEMFFGVPAPETKDVKTILRRALGEIT